MNEQLAARSVTWDALFDRFADFQAMACLRASGPDRRRPERNAVAKRLRHQFEREKGFLPESPLHVSQEHLGALLGARGAGTRAGGRRPAHRSLWNGLWRAIILDRDEYRCCFCKRSATDGVDVPGEGRLAIRLELDHVQPRATGGHDYALSNIRAICRTCNTARSRMTDAHFQAELVSIARSVCDATARRCQPRRTRRAAEAAMARG